MQTGLKGAPVISATAVPPDLQVRERQRVHFAGTARRVLPAVELPGRPFIIDPLFVPQAPDLL
jgi:hypothetical protein